MKKKKGESEETRTLILAAADALFSAKGYSNTSIVDIVKLTNYTRGAVYWHFNNKCEIYGEIIHQKLMNIQKEIEESFIPGIQLEDLLRASLLRLTSDTKYYFVNQAITLKLVHEELVPIANEVEAVKKLYYDHMRGFVEEELKQRDILVTDIEILIKFIYTIFEGTYQFVAQGVMRSPLSNEDLEFYVNMIMNGILANRSGNKV